jgi:hypothetical protein
LSGWTFDPNDSSKSLNVDVYVNGPAGSAPGKRYLANVYRPDVNAAYGITGNHGFSINPSTDSFLKKYVASGRSFTVYLYAIGVNSSGAPNGNNPLIGTRTIGSCLVHPPPPCPTFPGYKNVNVGMPYTGPSSSAHSSTTTQPADQSAPSNYNQYTPQKVMLESAPNGIIQDISAGGNRVVPTEVSEYDGTSGSTYSASGSAVLDYSIYVKTYPYDINQASVTYDSYYTTTVWTPSLSSITCTGSDKLSGTTCTHISTIPATGKSPDYVCPLGYTGGGTSSTCTKKTTYTATATYAWTAGTPTNNYQASPSVDAAQMPACFNRTFSLTTQNGSASYSSTVIPAHPTEDPTQVSFSGTVNATFGENSPPDPATYLRKPSQINSVTASVTVQVYHHTATGALVPEAYYPTGATYTTPVQIVSTSTSVPSSGNTSVSNTWTVSMPPLQYGDVVCFSLSVSPSTGQMNPNPTPWYPLYSSGSYTATPASCTSYAAAHPYFKIFGGDAMAGIGMQQLLGVNEVCSHNNAANLEGWNQLNSGSPPGGYAGAGTSLAAFAGSTINGFASAQNDPGGASPPNGLSFANTTPPASSIFGGFFGPLNSNECAPNYYYQGVNGDGGKNKVSIKNRKSLNAAIASGSGSYFASGGGTISSSLLNKELSKEQNITIYTNGNVTIDNNINYPILTSTTPTQLPGFTLVDNGGNINIDSNVNNLIGDYITNQNINTCYNIYSTRVNDLYTTTPADISDTAINHNDTTNCRTQLAVSGAFIAKNIDLLRTYKSLRFATPNGTNITSNAAEVFNYNPMVWLTTPTKILPPKVESITGLPPVL